MNSDLISIVDRLAPSLAWPLVALVALPFLIWRFDAVAKLYEFLTTDKGRSAIQSLTSINDNAGEMLRRVEESVRVLQGLSKSIQDIQQQIQQTDIDQISESSTKIENIVPGTTAEEETIAQSSKNISPQKLYDDIKAKWDLFQRRIVDKFEELKLPKPDLRSIGTAGTKLGDKRRRNPLTEDDVRLIFELYTQYKRFLRLESTVNEWLTLDVYASFIAALNNLVPKISGVGRGA